MTALTTLARAKQTLGLNNTDNDTLISELITRASDESISYLRVIEPDDGSANSLGREVYEETIRYATGDYQLFLSRRPVSNITSIVEGTTTLTASDYQINKATGVIERLGSDEISTWGNDKIVVTYEAGYLLPEEVGRNLPHDIEEAVIEIIRSRLIETGVVEPEIRSEQIEDVGRVSYVTSGSHSFKSGGYIPDRARALLSRHRNPMV